MAGILFFSSFRGDASLFPDWALDNNIHGRYSSSSRAGINVYDSIIASFHAIPKSSSFPKIRTVWDTLP